ncbi:MAG: hypothetical protein ISS82_03600 [Nanoarchaeota archaeon]|nr:hypothetical protein [Nanoarchaeota archaeon]
MFKIFNERIKRFSIWDIKLVSLSGLFIGLILVKLLEPIWKVTNINIWWFVLLVVIFIARPFYLIILKKIKNQNPKTYIPLFSLFIQV